MTFPKSPDLSEPPEDGNTPRGPMPTWLREAHDKVRAEEAERVARYERGKAIREAVELDDEPCSECGGTGEVEVQIDVDQVRVQACPECTDEPDADRDDAGGDLDLDDWRGR